MNKVFLVGRLGRGPQRFNDHLVSFDMATSNGKDKPPTWHRVKTWDKLAESCEKYLSTGREVVVEGTINNYKYEKNGIEMHGTEIIASRVVFVGDKGEKLNAHVVKDDVQAKDAFPDDMPF